MFVGGKTLLSTLLQTNMSAHRALNNNCACAQVRLRVSISVSGKRSKPKTPNLSIPTCSQEAVLKTGTKIDFPI